MFMCPTFTKICFCSICGILLGVCKAQDASNFFETPERFIPGNSFQDLTKPGSEILPYIPYEPEYIDTGKNSQPQEPISYDLGSFRADETTAAPIKKSFLDAICSETKAEIVESDVYNFLAENMAYIQGGLGAFGLAFVTFIIVTCRKFCQKKRTSTEQNSEDDRLLEVNTVVEEPSRDAPQLNNTNDAALLICI